MHEDGQGQVSTLISAGLRANTTLLSMKLAINIDFITTDDGGANVRYMIKTAPLQDSR